MNHAIVGIGSNVNPEEHVRRARAKLSSHYRVLGESSFVTTESVGPAGREPFLNGAVWLETPLTLEKLKEELKALEVGLGRPAVHDKWAPRTIDLDIVVWNDTVVDHDYYSREFLRRSVEELKGRKVIDLT